MCILSLNNNIARQKKESPKSVKVHSYMCISYVKLVIEKVVTIIRECIDQNGTHGKAYVIYFR